MAQIWKEQFDWRKHRNRMWGNGCEQDESRDQRLDPTWVYLVRTCSFTFEFHSLAQLETCLAYYSEKTHPSSRLSTAETGGADHWEIQRWFERLPQELLAASKRAKVVDALKKALVMFG